MEYRVEQLEETFKMHDDRLAALESGQHDTNSTLKEILNVLTDIAPVVENVKKWKERVIGGGVILLLVLLSSKLGLIDTVLAIL